MGADAGPITQGAQAVVACRVQGLWKRFQGVPAGVLSDGIVGRFPDCFDEPGRATCPTPNGAW
jgi:hypothetical protein